MQSFRYAEEVSVHDEILVHDSEKLIPVKVISISSLSMQGNYGS